MPKKLDAYRDCSLQLFGLTKKVWAHCILDWVPSSDLDIDCKLNREAYMCTYTCPRCGEQHTSVEIWSKA